MNRFQAKVNMDFYMGEAEFTEDMLEDKERADYEVIFVHRVRFPAQTN